MPPWLRTPAVLPEDPGLIASIYMSVTPVSWAPDMHMVQNTHTHEIYSKIF